MQRAVFDPVSRGTDLVVQARTGTGKTAAYGLPMIDSVVRRSSAVVQVLVLCPTRELALQVAREMEALAKYRGTKIAAVYGGAPMGAQVQKINEGAQLVAGTPGRVLDHLRRGTLDAKGIRAVVLDESDEMLSMGFLPQIDEILSFLPSSRQTLLFSATLPPEIQRLAETRLKTPEFITLSGDHIGALEISHFVYISRADKTGDLLQLLEVENPESAIVFCNTKESTKRVASALQQQGFDAEWLNADLGQSDREKVMEATRLGKLRFLVATDVAARGIDISHLTHVINYDFPESCEQYVHRTGRTGRAGKTGTALSLLEASDIGNLYMLRLTYKIKPVERQLPTSHDLKTRAETDLVQMFADLFAKRPVHPDDLALARRIQTHEAADRIIAGIVRDHLGARPTAGEQAAAARRAAPPKSVKGLSGPAAPRGAAPKVARLADRKPIALPAPPRTEPETPAGGAEPVAGEPQRVATAPRPVASEPQRAASRPEPQRAVVAAPVPVVSEPQRAVSGPVPVVSEPQPSEGAPPGSSEPPTQPKPARREHRQRAEVEGPTVPPVPRRGDAMRRGEREPRTEPREDRSESGDSEGNGRPVRGPHAAELFVSIGRKDGARASDFYAVLEQRAGITIDDTDYVNVRQRHTFIGLSKDLLARALEALNGATIAGREATAEPSRSNQ
ncbi:MAG TPA: DEAD/DEAH box helicase [Polyangiaceae bacterium]|nr:DEAD/DEAH box helicase [Polyangiaceae bacterium]